jgi:hypothetical protein
MMLEQTIMYALDEGSGIIRPLDDREQEEGG